MSTRTHFEKEAKGNSEMAHSSKLFLDKIGFQERPCTSSDTVCDWVAKQ